MGNCINQPLPLVHNVAKPAIEDNASDVTVGASSTNDTTISPPPSPIKQEELPSSSQKMIQQNDLHVPSPPLNTASILEQHKANGQNRLRELVTTSTNDEDIDWKAIISLADDLHRKEQQLLRSSYNKERIFNSTTGNECKSRFSSSSRSGTHISRRQSFFEKRRRRRELERRRKMESVGSFSVNLLAYDAVDEMRIRKESDQIYTTDDRSSKNIIVDDRDDELCISEDSDDVHIQKNDEIKSICPGCRPSKPPNDIILVGSFMAATSLFDSIQEVEASSSSDEDNNSTTSCGRLQRKSLDLMTIDENATL